MESTKRRYQPLMAVDILHHSFLDEGGKIFDGTQDLPAPRKAQKLKTYDVREWLLVEPDTSTRKALQAHGVLLKQTKTGFLLLAQLADALPGTRKPLANLEKMVLGFWLKWQLPELAAQTALAYRVKADGGRGVYLFGNQWARIFGGAYPHLTLPLPTYRPEEDYLPGDLVRKDAKHYRAIAKSKGAAVTDAAFWQPTDSKISYASRQSLQTQQAAVPLDVWGKIEISGKSGLSNYSLLTGTGDLKNSQVYKLHLDKM
ncbi:hypothetical protein [Rufibacter psychrotolerans]|uniref:hypothetical protein n=1 Tax=Rufibacter psychrotolerans TaxID=2812556 RepID=UPI00196723B1|nr:hypothetical protein [Rufibacter sp. SYSU D00308]